MMKLAQRGEELDLDSLWVADIPTVRSKGASLDPLTTLAAVAAVTRKVMLATGILLLPQRNYYELARELVNIDHISQGRLTVGVGVGHSEDEAKILGVDWRGRGALSEEMILAMRTLWSRDPSSYSGKYINFNNIIFLPKPIRGRIPIWMGAEKETALRRLAKLGDGWIAAGYSATTPRIREKLAYIHRFAKEYGRDPSSISVSNNVYIRVSDSGRAYEEARHHLELRYGMRVPPDMTEVGIFGDAEYCVRQLRARVESGVRHFNFLFTSDEFEQLELVSKEIIPAFRS
jgi:probable F420-dependent oxidoreductase